VGILVSNAVGMSLAEYASQKIWKPYGMETDAVWMTDLGDRERGGCCISMRLRDYARFGQFVLDGGKAAGRQIVPPDWTKEVTRVHISEGVPMSYGYGYFWWIRGSGAYDALGIFGQSITTFPDDRLIVVQNAAWPAAVDQESYAALNAFIEAVRKATHKQTKNPSHSKTENEKF